MTVERKVEYTVTISVAGYPEPTNPENITVREDEPFEYQLKAMGGRPPYKWYPGAMPAGVTLSESGLLAGTLPDKGAFPATYYIADTVDPPPADDDA